MSEQDTEVKIRAKSTLKLETKTGGSMTYEYPKGVPVKALLRDVLLAHHMNQGDEQCRIDVQEMMDGFKNA